MTKTYLTPQDTTITAIFIGGNVQWCIEGSKRQTCEPKKKFLARSKQWKEK